MLSHVKARLNIPSLGDTVQDKYCLLVRGLARFDDNPDRDSLCYLLTMCLDLVEQYEPVSKEDLLLTFPPESAMAEMYHQAAMWYASQEDEHLNLLIALLLDIALSADELFVQFYSTSLEEGGFYMESH